MSRQPRLLLDERHAATYHAFLEVLNALGMGESPYVDLLQDAPRELAARFRARKTGGPS